MIQQDVYKSVSVHIKPSDPNSRVVQLIGIEVGHMQDKELRLIHTAYWYDPTTKEWGVHGEVCTFKYEQLILCNRERDNIDAIIGWLQHDGQRDWARLDDTNVSTPLVRRYRERVRRSLSV